MKLPDPATERKIDALLERMTLEEKVEQLHGDARDRTGFSTRDNTRLKIPGLRNTDGPRGVRWGRATCFPVPLATAATWNPDLVKAVAVAMARETRAKGRDQLLAPCINICRDSRNGRTQEGYGEDPYLTARLAVAFVQGLHSERVMDCVKHYACNNEENDRHNEELVYIDERTLREIYLPAFKACVCEAGALSIMGAYNGVNGEYCCHNSHLLNEILREEWGFEGFVVSDWRGCHSTAKSINAGLDLEMPTGANFEGLVEAVRSGEVLEETLNRAVRRVLRAKIWTGTMEGNSRTLDESSVECLEHVELALDAAVASIVLLKNDGDLLPLNRSRLKSIAVIGPSADLARLGDRGSSRMYPSSAVTPLAGIMREAGRGITVGYAPGCTLAGKPPNNLAEAAALARTSDVAVVVVGLSGDFEGEGLDRSHFGLPGRQNALVNAICEANSRTVVVLVGGGAITMEGWGDRVPAILHAWYPGQAGGHALARVLFGLHNPSGKLPITLPRSEKQVPGFTRTYETEGPGYRWFDKRGLTPLFPFGHGLSYTTFEYSNLAVNRFRTGCSDMFSVSFRVRNSGDRPGTEVAQVYVRDIEAGVERADKELKGFARVVLQPGQGRQVECTLNSDALSFYDVERGEFVVEPGEFEVLVGSSSRDIRVRARFMVHE